MPYIMSATDHVRLIFDNDNDEADRQFIIEHNNGGAIEILWSVHESGDVTVYGEVKRSGTPVTFDNVSAVGDITAFKSAGTIKAKVDGAGKGVFFYGIRLVRDTGANDPNTAGRAGDTGDLVLWYNPVTAKDEIWACNDGAANTWNWATQ